MRTVSRIHVLSNICNICNFLSAVKLIMHISPYPPGVLTFRVDRHGLCAAGLFRDHLAFADKALATEDTEKTVVSGHRSFSFFSVNSVASMANSFQNLGCSLAALGESVAAKIDIRCAAETHSGLTRTSCLPMFSPSNRPRKILGAFSKPSSMFSRYFNWPSSTQCAKSTMAVRNLSMN
ncbi:hypothetical protein Pan258_21050 [Symmachiella dynata]|nr:hypothetical protein Pan258_21050 [Symmachiella dynata]